MRRSVSLPSVWLLSLSLAATSLAVAPLTGGAKELSTKGVLLDRVVAVVNDGRLIRELL